MTTLSSSSPTMALVIAAIALALPGVARAETLLLLPAHGDRGLRSVQAQAERVLEQALEAQAVHVLRLEQAIADHPETLKGQDCAAVECAASLLRATGADAAVVLAVWAAPGEPDRPGSIFLTLIDRADARFPGRVKLAKTGSAGVARAVKDALLEARALQLLGPGPWLRVHGDPEGAQVLLNGKLAGTLPYRAAIEPGRHTVEVRSTGYRPEVQSVDVPPNATRQVELQVTLPARGARHGQVSAGAPAVADAEAAAAADPDSSGSRPLVGPLLLGAAGVGLITADLVLVLGSDCEHRNSQGACERGYEVDDALAITWAAIGASAIVSAVLWHILGGDDPPKAAVAVQGRTRGIALVALGHF